jgi:rod shape-determining protein MreD
MNRTVSVTKVVVSLLLAMLLSVMYLPVSLQVWMPPWVAVVVFYWLIFQTTSLGVWSVWLVGLLTGSLVGDPIGINSFLLVILAWPLLHNQRLLQFMASSSGWLLWLLVSVGFVVAKTALLLLFAHVAWSWGLCKPLLSVFIVAPFIYLLLSLYTQFSLSHRRIT